MRPILKWAGGKTALLENIKKLIPNQIDTYYEPFFGGGAVFFGIELEKAIINDKNSELINCYSQVRDSYEAVVFNLDKLQRKHSEEEYYKLRDEFNKRKRSGKALNEYDAALMLYLNKAGFNGMYRENMLGDFNIPSGHRKNVVLYNAKNLKAVSEKLRIATLLNLDFEKAVVTAKAGDFVYFDSPYDKTFSNYNQEGFSRKDHERLAKICRDLHNKNVKFLLSSSDSEFIRNLYQDFDIIEVQVKRMIGFKGNRNQVTELLIKNY